jgi:hypothetical protein
MRTCNALRSITRTFSWGRARSSSHILHSLPLLTSVNVPARFRGAPAHDLQRDRTSDRHAHVRRAQDHSASSNCAHDAASTALASFETLLQSLRMVIGASCADEHATSNSAQLAMRAHGASANLDGAAARGSEAGAGRRAPVNGRRSASANRRGSGQASAWRGLSRDDQAVAASRFVLDTPMKLA